MALFKKKEPEFEVDESMPKQSSKGALLVLLLLVAVFAYLYFFTSLIVPHEVDKPEPAVAGSPEIKQAMPAKPATPADAKKPEEPKTPVATVVVPAAPASKPSAQPAPVPVTAAAKPVTPAPAAAPAKPAAPAAVSNAAPVKSAAPVPAAAPVKPAAALTPAVAASKKEEPKGAKPAGEKTAATTTKVDKKNEHSKEKVKEKKIVHFTVFAGDFASGEETDAAVAKIGKAGVKPVAKSLSNKSRVMTRLFVASYSDYDEYSAALAKLKKTAQSFGIEKDGKYSLYAGSFSEKSRAEKERKDLAAKGVNAQLQQIDLSISSVRVTAGDFSSQAEAQKAADKIKKEGLTPKVISKGK